MSAGALQRAVPDAPEAAAISRPADFTEAQRSSCGLGMGEQAAAFAPACDEMLDADVIWPLPKIDGRDRAQIAVDHEHRAVVRISRHDGGRKGSDCGGIRFSGTARVGCSHGLARAMLRHFSRSV